MSKILDHVRFGRVIHFYSKSRPICETGTIDFYWHSGIYNNFPDNVCKDCINLILMKQLAE